MWSSEQDINHHHHHHLRRNSAVMSSSSSSRSSPSSNTSVLVPQSSAAATPKRRTMEEVWKDINLTTLHQERQHPGYGHHHRHPHRQHHLAGCSSPSFRNVILQDFFAGPLSRPLAPVSSPAVEELPPPPPPPVPPHTILSLNSGLEFQFLGHDANSHSNSASNAGPNAASFTSSTFSAVIAGPPSPNGLFSLCSKKRLPEYATPGVDRHNKRMIKNRESAARSRARKQAYTNELELEVSHLKEENTKLKKQCDELRLTMGNQQLKRNALQRSSTAPF